MTTTAFAKPATLLVALLIAVGAAGCGDNQTSSEESLPDRPQLTVPNGSVAAGKKRDSSATDVTGSSGTSTSQTTAGTNSGGAAAPQDTGGQGTGTGTGTGQTTPQDTGGAAPGN